MSCWHVRTISHNEHLSSQHGKKFPARCSAEISSDALPDNAYVNQRIQCVTNTGSRSNRHNHSNLYCMGYSSCLAAPAGSAIQILPIDYSPLTITGMIIL